MLDRRGGQLNPLSYARGLAQAAMQQGAAVHGTTKLRQAHRTGTGCSWKPPTAW
jgi:glycine/D-amino acid oxidase-like deaminating enzyme